MPFLGDVMCESAAESPWLPGWILVEKQLRISWISFQRQQSPAARTARGPNAPHSSQLHGWFKAL